MLNSLNRLRHAQSEILDSIAALLDRGNPVHIFENCPSGLDSPLSSAEAVQAFDAERTDDMSEALVND